MGSRPEMGPTGEMGALAEALFAALERRLRELVRSEFEARGEERAGPVTEEVAPEALISTERAAEIAGVAPATVREWVARGRLAGHRAGRLLRIRRAELERFLAEGAGPTVAARNDIEARKARALQRLR